MPCSEDDHYRHRAEQNGVNQWPFSYGNQPEIETISLASQVTGLDGLGFGELIRC